MKLLLENTGSVEVRGCLSVRSGHLLWGQGEFHASYKEEQKSNADNCCFMGVSLEPGKSLDWSEEVKATDVGTGKARLRFWLEVVDPKTCTSHRFFAEASLSCCCDGNLVFSNEVALAIQPN